MCSSNCIPYSVYYFSLEPVSTPKALTGRNLTLLTRKRQREVPTKRYWWKQPEVRRRREIAKEKSGEIILTVFFFFLSGQVEQSGVVKTLTQLQLELQEVYGVNWLFVFGLKSCSLLLSLSSLPPGDIRGGDIGRGTPGCHGNAGQPLHVGLRPGPQCARGAESTQ